MSASSPLPNAFFCMVEIPPPYAVSFIWKHAVCRGEIVLSNGCPEVEIILEESPKICLHDGKPYQKERLG
jgi:hypothetical protein